MRSAAGSRRLSRRSANAIRRGAVFTAQIAVRDRHRPIAGSGSPHIPGAMSRHGNPYDGAKAESFMKTLKAEAVYLRDYETFED
jgi:transposase InsO family protein